MLYESFIHPLTILSTLPSAGIGALLALSLGHMDLSVIGIIGIILLIGIVKKNGIMLVDFAIAAERDRHMEPLAAIREACLLRFRPILMTTAAAMLAGIPLAIGNGAGSEMRQPLGYAMVGGLALSQVLTLYTTPVVYLYLDRLQTLAVRRQARSRSEDAEAGSRRRRRVARRATLLRDQVGMRVRLDALSSRSSACSTSSRLARPASLFSAASESAADSQVMPAKP